MRPLMPVVFLLVWSTARAGAAPADLVENVLVPGGVAAMTHALALEGSIDRARAVAELARLLHGVEPGVSQDTDARVRKLHDYLAGLDASAAPSETIPIPLTRAVWEKAVFGRPTPDLLSAILTDRRASLLVYGLAALDDETLAYFAANPEFVNRLYSDHAGAFAAFGESLRIRNGRVVVPGGAAAASVWETLLNDSADRPDRFIRWLFRRPFAPYVYALAANLDAPRRAFLLGLWMPDARQRVDRLRQLLLVTAAASRLWDVERRPFFRLSDDLATLVMSIRAAADGTPQSSATRRFWDRAFETIELPANPDRDVRDDKPELIDAAWITERVLVDDPEQRRLRAAQFAFGQRLPPARSAPERAGSLVAVRAFPRYRALMLILERIGVEDASIYVRGAKTARAISGLGNTRALIALQQFQGALALIDRLHRAHALPTPIAVSVTSALVDRPVTERGFDGGVVSWITDVLAPALKMERVSERELVALAAGGRSTEDNRQVKWEGESYTVDLSRGETERVLAMRAQQESGALEEALGFRDERTVGDALASMAFAFEVRDAKAAVSRENLAARHDFGLAHVDSERRHRQPWADATVEVTPGQPWHTRGSILALDIALGHLGLQRSGASAVAEPSRVLSENERNTFTRSFGALNAMDLEDAAQAGIAAATQRGRARVERLGAAPGSVGAMADDIELDGWRRRAVAWAVTHDPQAVPGYFTMIDYLRLGGGVVSPQWSAWGMERGDCYGLRLPFRFEHWAASWREQRGTLAAQVTDLNLRVAELLDRLHLPASLTKVVLARTLQTYLDRVRPVDVHDWLSLVREAQQVGLDDVEDAVASLTVDGPLYPVGPAE